MTAHAFAAPFFGSFVAPFVAPLLVALTLLAGCSSVSPRATGNAAGSTAGSAPLAPDRTFSVPVYGNEQWRADATAKAECRKQGLYHKLLRSEGARMLYQCVREAPAP
jgi:hypothetical protein